MKKVPVIILVVLVLTLTVVGASGCVGGIQLKASDENLGNYEGKTPVEGMSAFDLVTESYNNMLVEKNYTREEDFVFQTLHVKLATRNTHLVRKIVDGKVYNQEVIYGTGMDKGTCAKRFYYDGSDAYAINNTAGNNISYKKDSNEYTVKNWGEFASFEGDLQNELSLLKNKITTYDISTRDMLSPTHDDSVYMVDGVYYCTLKIDCALDKMKTVQRAALEEFLDTLGATDEGFEIDDTTIDFAIAKIDGKYKFLIWKRNEKYSGKHATMSVRVSCEQTCIGYYTYGNAVITNDDLLNLA